MELKMKNIEFKEKIKTLQKCQGNFFAFTENIFSKSFTNFISGKYVEESCNQLSKHDRTMRIAFRSGFKSTSFYSYVQNLIMFRGIKEDLDIRYFSYNETMACFDNKTEVLTINGFKNISEVKKGEKIATRAKSGQIRYEPISEKFEYLYNGKMYKIQTKKLSLLITPNHNVFYRTFKNKNYRLGEIRYLHKNIWMQNDKQEIKINKKNIQQVNYNGKVYCVNVPNHILLVRRNGKMIWSGNSFHVQQIRSLIRKNPYFNELINLKPIAENLAAYTWDKKHIIKISPVGVISFSRGLKSDVILLDDILSDPVNPIHPTIILKINDIFRSVILESLRPNGEIHIIGSPLSASDLYFDPAIQKEFHFRQHPAIIKDNEGNEVPAWPEFYSLEKLKKKVFIMGEKAFQAEMMMVPYYSTDSFFKKEQLRKDIVNPQLKNIRLVEGFNTPNLVIAGLDIGRKKHISSFSVFEIRDGKAIQIHQKNMKGWKYYNGKKFDPFHPTQVEYCREAIKNFCIGYLYYDNTRGEFEGASDSGLLTTHFVPIVFTSKMKVQMATDFEKIVLNKQIEMFDDEELLESLCSVTNDLQKLEVGDKHSDVFDSFCLAMIGFTKFGASGKQDKEIRVGAKSIFHGLLPKGW